MSREAAKEATTTDPNSVLGIEAMELLVDQNDNKQNIISTNTLENTQTEPDSVLDIDSITVSKMYNELDPLIPSVQNQNEATRIPTTTPRTNRGITLPKDLSSYYIGFIGSPLSKFSAYPLSPYLVSAINSPNSPFKPRIPDSSITKTQSTEKSRSVDEISKSPLRDLRKPKQYQSISDSDFTPKILDLESFSGDEIYDADNRDLSKRIICQSSDKVFTPKQNLDLESKSDDKISNSPQRFLSHSKRKQCQSSDKVFTPKNLDLESKSDVKIFNSSTKHLRTQKQYQLLLEDKSPALYSKTNLYQYASDMNSKVRVSNEKSFVGDELSKLVIANVTSAKEQFLARCIKKKIDVNTENINEFVLKVIEFAQTNEGVSKVSDGENKWQEFTKDNEALNQFSYKDTKVFSSIYQSVSGENGVYSGRQENLRSDIKVAARLKRIPAGLNDRIEQSLNQKVETRSI